MSSARANRPPSPKMASSSTIRFTLGVYAPVAAPDVGERAADESSRRASGWASSGEFKASGS
ncbi:hypothetical protein DP42_5303 [Burkholderia pseudomallei]|nr:hypothetical protein DP42_5303 [Burkholderia pseudomallei]